MEHVQQDLSAVIESIWPQSKKKFGGRVRPGAAETPSWGLSKPQPYLSQEVFDSSNKAMQ